MYKKIEDCCKYQEQIKKLTKTKRKKMKVIPVHDECEERGEEHVRGAVKKKLTPVKSRYSSDIERGIERIKPSVRVRDEYSFSRHLQCVMENSAKSRIPGDVDGDSIVDTRKSKRRKEPMTKMKHNGQDLDSKKIKLVKFSGKGRKQIERTEGSTDSNSSSECDEICSFDSDINLSGVTLTVKDRETVMDNYTKAHTSLTNTGNNMNKSEIDEIV